MFSWWEQAEGLGFGVAVQRQADRRRHSKKQIRQIAASIGSFGFNVPILIDRDGNVIAGHGRLLAGRELG